MGMKRASLSLQGRSWVVSLPDGHAMKVPLANSCYRAYGFKLVSIKTSDVSNCSAQGSLPNLRNVPIHCLGESDELQLSLLPDGQLVQLEKSDDESVNPVVLFNLHSETVFYLQLEVNVNIFIADNGLSFLIAVENSEIGKVGFMMPGKIEEAVVIKGFLYTSNGRNVLKVKTEDLMKIMTVNSAKQDNESAGIFEEILNQSQVYACRNVISIFENLVTGNLIFKNKFGFVFDADACSNNENSHSDDNLDMKLASIGKTTEQIACAHSKTKSAHDFLELLSILNRNQHCGKSSFKSFLNIKLTEFNEKMIILLIENKTEYLFKENEAVFCLFMLKGDESCESICFYLNGNLRPGEKHKFLAPYQEGLNLKTASIQFVLRNPSNSTAGINGISNLYDFAFVFEVPCELNLSET